MLYPDKYGSSSFAIRPSSITIETTDDTPSSFPNDTTLPSSRTSRQVCPFQTTRQAHRSKQHYNLDQCIDRSKEQHVSSPTFTTTKLFFILIRPTNQSTSLVLHMDRPCLLLERRPTSIGVNWSADAPSAAGLLSQSPPFPSTTPSRTSLLFRPGSRKNSSSSILRHQDSFGLYPNSICGSTLLFFCDLTHVFHEAFSQLDTQNARTGSSTIFCRSLFRPSPGLPSRIIGVFFRCASQQFEGTAIEWRYPAQVLIANAIVALPSISTG